MSLNAEAVINRFIIPDLTAEHNLLNLNGDRKGVKRPCFTSIIIIKLLCTMGTRLQIIGRADLLVLMKYRDLIGETEIVI